MASLHPLSPPVDVSGVKHVADTLSGGWGWGGGSKPQTLTPQGFIILKIAKSKNVRKKFDYDLAHLLDLRVFFKKIRHNYSWVFSCFVCCYCFIDVL